jgi:hypothetical protein
MDRIHRMNSILLVMLAVLFLLMVAAIKAPADTVTVQLTSVNGKSQGGVDVDPYYGTIDGTPAVLVCDDFAHETTIGEQWTATVSTFADLSSVRFQQGTAAETLKDYEEVAWLYEALMANPSDYGNISFALWAVFTPSAEHSSGFTTNGKNSAAYWLNQAEEQTFYAGEFSNFEILTPTNSSSNSPQEFLTCTPTPEPASVILLISGLAMFSLVWRKRLAV